MLEFIRLDRPPLSPQKCIACDQYTGPMVDTHREVDFHGRVYVCSSCIRRLAICEGIAKGKEMTRLLNADRLLRDAQERVTDLEQQVIAADKATLAETRRADTLQTQLDEAVNLERTRAHQLEELQRQASALVGAN